MTTSSVSSQSPLPNIRDIDLKGKYSNVKTAFKNLSAGIKLIFSRAKTTGSVCQILGAAALTLAAIAAVSAGALSTLTGIGAPVGLPLVAIGLGLFTAGSYLTWRDISQHNPDASFKDKIKEFFKRSAKNTGIGVGIGAVAGIAAANVGLATKVVAGIGTIALFIGKNLGHISKVVDEASNVVDQVHKDEPIKTSSTNPELETGMAAAELLKEKDEKAV